MGLSTKLDEALATAVQLNCGKCIQSLVKVGANPNLYQNAVTPLIRASCSGDAETVAVLIKAGADINAINATYPSERSLDFNLHGSENNGADNSETYLNQDELEVKDKDGNDSYGDDEKDDDGDDVEEELLNYNYYNDHSEDKDNELQRAGGHSTLAKAIFHAAANGHHECLDLLLKAGADVNDRNPRDGNTPLIKASYCFGDECEATLKGMNPYSYSHLPWKIAKQEGFFKMHDVTYQRRSGCQCDKSKW